MKMKITTLINEKNRKVRGFSLIELMITIAIMSVLISLAAYSFLEIRNRIRRASCHENMRTILRASILAQTERSDLDGQNLTVQKLIELRYLKAKFACPSGGTYWIQSEKENIRVTCKNATDGSDHGYMD